MNIDIIRKKTEFTRSFSFSFVPRTKILEGQGDRNLLFLCYNSTIIILYKIELIKMPRSPRKRSCK